MDEALVIASNGMRTPLLDGVMGFLGNWGYVAFPLLLAALALRTRTRASLRNLLDGWLAFLLALFVVETFIKPLVDRPRPSSIEALAPLLHVLGRAPSSPSFPSGTATACAAAVTWMALRHREAPLDRVILAVSMLLALVVSFARVYAAAHWPTDLFAGWLCGAATAYAVHHVTAHRDGSEKGAAQ